MGLKLSNTHGQKKNSSDTESPNKGKLVGMADQQLKQRRVNNPLHKHDIEISLALANYKKKLGYLFALSTSSSDVYVHLIQTLQTP